MDDDTLVMPAYAIFDALRFEAILRNIILKVPEVTDCASALVNVLYTVFASILFVSGYAIFVK